MKTVLSEFLEELKEHGFYPTESKAIELLEKEKRQTINFAHKCRLINDIDLDGNVSFVFTPELQFNQMYDEQ